MKRYAGKTLSVVIAAAAHALAVLPLRVLYLLSDFLFFVGYHLIGYRKGVVRKNLSLAFPEKSAKERLEIEKGFYRHLADVIVETLKLLHISDAEIDRRVEVSGAGMVDEAAEHGVSTILFLGHYGNWEWVPAITHHFLRRQIFAQIYSPLHDEISKRVVWKIRNRFGAENIPKNRAYRRLLEITKGGGQFVTGFIADQRPLGNNLHNWTKFLGVDTAYMVGGETIGDKLGAVFLYLDVEKLARGHYRLTFRKLEPLKDGLPDPVTRAYLHALENTIRREPRYWLWSHNRWRAHRVAEKDAAGNKGAAGK